MQDDPPTMPNLRPFREDAGERDFGVSPTWPLARGDAGARRSSATRGSEPLVLGVSLGVNVVLLVGLVGVLLLARAGAFAASTGTAPPTAAGSAGSSALSSPTPTTLGAGGWLQVAASSVRLGCDGDQRTQVVVLTNTGPQAVQWQVVLGVPLGQAAIDVAPNQGNLQAGASTVLQIHNRPHPATQQGIVRIDPQSPTAGTPPSFSYIAPSCA
ncbi:MAG TPA: hypothetical protein VGS80_17150 [Ktedonobacterales bacterium]|nr:hypothetical protein [Ktedonobacterales bacterium]